MLLRGDKRQMLTDFIVWGIIISLLGWTFITKPEALTRKECYQYIDKPFLGVGIYQDGYFIRNDVSVSVDRELLEIVDCEN